MNIISIGDANPPENMSSWYKCQGHGSTRDTDVAHFAHDIYAIGTQVYTITALVRKHGWRSG